jgi:hypothetical protein
MGFNAPGTNHPLRRRTERAWKRAEQLALRLMEKDPSLTKAEAMDKAVSEMRDNGRGDWRAG